MPAVIPTSQPGPPRFITPDEHKQLTASTPTSFGDIPPVLRHKEENVQVVLDPPIPELGSTDKGTLYIIERRVNPIIPTTQSNDGIDSALAFVWPSGTGFTVEYPRITLHAVSRGETGPSVYCQLDESVNGPGADEDDQEESEMRELRIVPSNPESVEPIFEALSLCAALHPDPNDDGGDEGDWVDDGEGGFETFDGTGEEELSEVGRPPLAQNLSLDSFVQFPHGVHCFLLSQAALAHLESIIFFPNEVEENEPNEDALEDAPEETKGEKPEPTKETNESKAPAEPATK